MTEPKHPLQDICDELFKHALSNMVKGVSKYIDEHGKLDPKPCTIEDLKDPKPKE